MNKPELIEAIATKAELQKKDTEAFLKAFTEVVTEELSEKHLVQIVGFGTFSAVEVAERTGTIQLGDRKGETYTTPSHWKPAFKAGKALKEAVK